ncbi:MAG: hypothetical protein IAE79_05895 [Anaerolinea sp.]|nr:hypothetical protein [Anaerolinea sp.]
MDDESMELLAVMSLTGWEAVENDDGQVVMFLHGNGGIVPFEVALAHWRKEGATPLPFVQVLTVENEN